MNERLILLYDTSDLVFQQKICLIYISNPNVMYAYQLFGNTEQLMQLADKVVRKAVSIYIYIFVSPGA